MSAIAWLSLALYAAVGLCCAASLGVSFRMKRPFAHRIVWLAGAALFGLLIASRFLGAEEAARTALRSFLQENGEYGERAAFQVPVAVAAVLIWAAGMVAIAVWFRRASGYSDIVVRIGCVGLLGMANLVGLRVLSFHPIDRLLYGGGLHLNWVFDGSLSLLVGVAAAAYIRRQRAVVSDVIGPKAGRHARRPS